MDWENSRQPGQGENLFARETCGRPGHQKWEQEVSAKPARSRVLIQGLCQGILSPALSARGSSSPGVKFLWVHWGLILSRIKATSSLKESSTRSWSRAWAPGESEGKGKVEWDVLPWDGQHSPAGTGTHRGGKLLETPAPSHSTSPKTSSRAAHVQGLLWHWPFPAIFEENWHQFLSKNLCWRGEISFIAGQEKQDFQQLPFPTPTGEKRLHWSYYFLCFCPSWNENALCRTCQAVNRSSEGACPWMLHPKEEITGEGLALFSPRFLWRSQETPVPGLSHSCPKRTPLPTQLKGFTGFSYMQSLLSSLTNQNPHPKCSLECRN